MSEHPAPLWRDPLFSPGDRFPLGPPRGILEDCQEAPSGPATRPFSLRHVVSGARLDTPPTWRYTYCHERQIALVYDEDGSLVPLLRHTKPGATVDFVVTQDHEWIMLECNPAGAYGWLEQALNLPITSALADLLGNGANHGAHRAEPARA